MNYYLKVNRDTTYAYQCLKKWIEIIQEIKNSYIYIVCDKIAIINKINTEFGYRDRVVYLKSKKDGVLEDVVPLITDKVWENAGYAHLTTIYHAVQNQQGYFWNIDADDIMLCAPNEIVREILYKAEKCMKDGYDALSLDMNTSRTNGRLWSFGITIMDAKTDWFSIIYKYAKSDDYKRIHELWRSKNANCVDFYFSYMKKLTYFKLSSFYVENMKFVHYSSNFLLVPYDGGIYQWKKGKFISLMLYYIYSAKRIGALPIAKSVIKLHTIDIDESDRFLQSYIPMIKNMMNSVNPFVLQNIADDLDAVIECKTIT